MSAQQYLYCIRDTALGESGPLFEAKNDVIAIRNFKRVVEQVRIRDEFVLLECGVYDHETDKGKITRPRQIPVVFTDEDEAIATQLRDRLLLQQQQRAAAMTAQVQEDPDGDSDDLDQ